MHFFTLLLPITLGWLFLPAAADPPPNQCGKTNGKWDIKIGLDSCPGKKKCIPSIQVAQATCARDGGISVTGRYSYLSNSPNPVRAFFLLFPLLLKVFMRGT